MYNCDALKASKTLKLLSADSFTEAVFASSSPAVPIAGSVAAVAMHAAHAIAVAEVEIFALTVITSLMQSLDRLPVVPLSGRDHPSAESNLP
jgi:hypothetical protein